MTKITLDEFENLPVLEGPPFMVPGTTKRYLDKDLAAQQEFVKERAARFYILHFFEATMNSSGQLEVKLSSETVFDETKPEVPDIEFKQFLGQTKDDRMKEIQSMQIKKLSAWGRLKLAFRVLLGKE